MSVEEALRVQEYVTRKALAAVGNLPGTFTLTVYQLMRNGVDSSGATTGFQVGRLLAVPTVLKCCHSAAKVYGLSWSDETNTPQVDALTMASLLFAVYMHRRLVKMCDPKEWELMTPGLLLDVLVVPHTAQMIEKKAFGPALLATMGMYSAFGAFCAIDKKSFKEYRRIRKQDRFFSRPEVEVEMFGATAHAIALAIIQSFRFGTEIADAMSRGFDRSVPQSMLSPQAKMFRSSALLLELAQDKEKMATSSVLKELSIDNRPFEEMRTLLSSPPSGSWLDNSLG